MNRHNIGVVLILCVSAVLFTSGVIRKWRGPAGQAEGRPVIAAGDHHPGGRG